MQLQLLAPQYGYYQYGKFEVVTAKNYQYLRNVNIRRFCREYLQIRALTKALRDYFALAESQPTSATLVVPVENLFIEFIGGFLEIIEIH